LLVVIWNYIGDARTCEYQTVDYLMNIMLTPLLDVTVVGVFHNTIHCIQF